MKKILFTIIASAALLAAKAQSGESSKGTPADTTVFSVVQKAPDFPGGMNEFNRYVEKNIQYPAVARQRDVHGKVLLTLIIEKDGSVSHIKVARGVSPEIDAEAVRVLKASPKWNPGTQNGSAVRVIYTVPVYFDLSGK